MSKCYFLKDKTQRFNGKTSDTNKEAGQKKRPFSRRTFRKEVNTLARKAVKKGALGIYASTLKRQQDKESKAKMAKRTRKKWKIPPRWKIPYQSTMWKN
jgi:predicted kinase